MPEKIQIVDKNDQPTGHATREEAWAKGLCCRAVQIVVRDEDGNFLLQKRSLNKALFPGCWTNAATGHVDEGEEYETAASRELEEEIGLSTSLRYIGKTHVRYRINDKHVNQFHTVFEAVIPHDTQFALSADEVSEVRWFTPDDLRLGLTKNVEDFTLAMADAIRQFYLH